jgi:hypothetical protein
MTVAVVVVVVVDYKVVPPPLDRDLQANGEAWVVIEVAMALPVVLL